MGSALTPVCSIWATTAVILSRRGWSISRSDGRRCTMPKKPRMLHARAISPIETSPIRADET